jgi:hypothetical protein
MSVASIATCLIFLDGFDGVGFFVKLDETKAHGLDHSGTVLPCGDSDAAQLSDTRKQLAQRVLGRDEVEVLDEQRGALCRLALLFIDGQHVFTKLLCALLLCCEAFDTNAPSIAFSVLCRCVDSHIDARHTFGGFRLGYCL